MFEKILIPIDLSVSSEKLVSCADRIKKVNEIVLLHIVPVGKKSGSGTEDPLVLEHEAMQALEKRVRNPDTVVRCIVAEDNGSSIPDAILRIAEAEKPSLIVMGARKGLLSRSLLGGGGTEILTQCRTHVLILQFPGHGIFSTLSPEENPGELFNRILFPLDFSRPANEALASVRTIEDVSEIILLHVIRKIENPDAMNLIVREVEKRLSEAREKIKQEHPDIRIRMMVRFGDPTDQICTVAAEEQVTLVIMSRYGKQDYIRKIPLGTTTSKVTAHIKKPVLVMFTRIQLELTARELEKGEFYLAEKIRYDYHQTKSDPLYDRIFAVFIEDTPVSVARCKQHDDWYEVDGIFTWEEFRGNGYARYALDTLIRECGDRGLSIYAVRHLVDFYTSLGFVPIPEEALPATIRERYSWAMGNMEGADVAR